MLRTVALLTAVLCACGSQDLAGEGAGPSTKKVKDAGAQSVEPGAFAEQNDAGSGDGGQEGCSDAAKLVYVVGYEDRGLYSFKPDELAFKRIGTVSCADAKTLPRSMAVDRHGVAWINHTNGRIYKVSTADASCVDSGFEPPNASWRLVNMGFASDAPGSSAETLYVVNSTTSGVRGMAKIDPATLKLTPIGDFSGELSGAIGELTGTGTARLFGFFKTMGQMTFSELDPKTAASIGANVKVQDTLVTPTKVPGYAFSFWGGDFWFYVATSEHPSSKVIRYKASGDKSQTVVMDDVGGFQIVGAGVSTCAPTSPVVH